MDLLKWDGTMSVGIDLLDEEHEKLTNYINTLHAAMERGADRSVIKELYENLIEYTNFHFHHEEILFMSSGYPETEQQAHIREHEVIKAKLLSVHDDLESGSVETLSRDLMVSLVDWLVKHTQGVDMRYVPYVQKKLSGTK